MNFWTGLIAGMVISSAAWAFYHFKVFTTIRKEGDAKLAEAKKQFDELMAEIKALKDKYGIK